MSRRSDATHFEPGVYYTLSNTNLSGMALSFGSSVPGNETIVMTRYKQVGSENWQLFFQSGRYYIRNRDYGAGWQLGFESGKETSPKMYARSGSVSQQWTIDLVLGGRKLRNGAVEKMVFALRNDRTLVMQREDNTDGEIWSVNRRDPGEPESSPITEDMLRQVDGMELISTASSTSTSTMSTSAFASPALSSPSAQQMFPSGAKAGIAIGVLAFVTIVAIGLWFIVMRKKRSRVHRVQKDGVTSVYESDSNARNELPAWPTRLQSARDSDMRDRANLVRLP
ncbi:hypothetical protein HBI09_003890 [Parastagonospora nodorum]|nr:hypothetical protein HBI09_003890 [Parastagonospora nodorum]KAH4072654.1 hypothetical protein HBH50_062360 [Parastagonospora nodorum]KAH4099197.1 hypothetical protein HBH48_004000 [Parastagonospora nodorum]KAH5027004.1 hypothetical protein HBI77_003900 [Parastagonospora nodorum]